MEDPLAILVGQFESPGLTCGNAPTRGALSGGPQMRTPSSDATSVLLIFRSKGALERRFLVRHNENMTDEKENTTVSQKTGRLIEQRSSS
jgi:hypothetical protein